MRVESNTQPRSGKQRRGDLDLESKPGQVVPDHWIIRIDHAIRYLGDRGELNANPLARLAYVERLAETKYAGKVLPRGLALRDALRQCVDKIVAELGNEPGMAKACHYLNLRSGGLACRRISDELGLSREHISRTIRRKALLLLAEEFLSLVKTGRRDVGAGNPPGRRPFGQSIAGQTESPSSTPVQRRIA